MRKIWNSRPRKKTIITLVIAGLIFALLFELSLAVGVFLASLLAFLLWVRNYDPETFYGFITRGMPRWRSRR